MKIIELLKRERPFVSLEFFPPKEKSAWPGFFDVVNWLRPANPLFVSVTYGAGGGTQANTLEIVSRMKREYGLEPMAHLTCVGASEKNIRAFLDALVDAGVDNVLALRGDPPKGQADFIPDSDQFRHASDLVAFIRAEYPSLCIGVAAYPEVHPQAVSPEMDLEYLKRKLDAGGDFGVTQLFFDNRRYFEFVARARAQGIDAPMLPGVLPVISLAGVRRMLSFCGATIPPDYLRSLEEADAQGGSAAVAERGIAYATAQARELISGGAPGVHLYTLNKAEACLRIIGGLGL
ncbi:methylenetetrahydrofolate reductase [NAD(P)H] [Desulfolutivibrio sulfoxidireducens]|uniref:methylenetetrahydrofolate reductase [NAD(P)H] n=1 Tax=Desulfolutivibrio sulfoxidireducens TaxID=2773299 RepID=UPI00159D8AB4|nr:methylenetetrahydrofolate reductase [NAD(P)H] [Desulfolutivibrio sulfoxidireducens]QLA15882.1 methylenetetrahydrofolate reductase [NAD(P)H] [Desulfolutivibrio sulfoxidireducens]QLA20216.1 methylenetetrahydrofolate reductase [NAD(P)H] [Desulfolutivibrio sulfoxidireducens]